MRSSKTASRKRQRQSPSAANCSNIFSMASMLDEMGNAIAGSQSASLQKKLQGLELRDLYYLKSICEDGRRRGVPFGKVFFGSLKVHEPELLQTTNKIRHE